MIVKRSSIEGVHSKVYFDRDLKYRYALLRRWAEGPIVVWIMLNPSTADETVNDATLNRCQFFSKRDGFAGFGVVNLFAYRSPHPEDLDKVENPEGDPANSSMILSYALAYSKGGGKIVAGWGTHKKAKGPGALLVQELVYKNLITLECLGITRDGHPRHPLYIPSYQQFVTYREP